MPLPYWFVRTAPANELRRFDPGQKRDPNGEWGDGIPGPGLPDLDMDGFDLTARVEGSFGTLELGVDKVGDVRMAFREGHEPRAVDLGSDEVADLRDILERLVESRAELDETAESGEAYDDDRFGYDNAHKVELLGNGVISITFGAEDDDPYTLNLDPPYEADPEDPNDGDVDDAQLVLDAIDDVLNEVDAGRSAIVGELRKFHPDQPRDPGGEDGGQWVSSPGSAASHVARLVGQAAVDATPAKLGNGRLTFSSGDPGWSLAEYHDRVAALEGYQGNNDYITINRSLRGILTDQHVAAHAATHGIDRADAPAHIDRQIALIDSVMDASKLTSHIRVTRGTQTGRGVFGDRINGDLTGFEWTEDAYVSTAADPATAEYFTRSGLLLDINVPAGTKAVNLAGDTAGSDEAEVLLQRGLRMRVVSDTGPGNPRRLEVEVVRD